MHRILYSNCWEDAEVVNKALAVTPGSTYFSIASAGDNTLGILSYGPGMVLAVDRNPAQLACLDIRRAAIEHLSYEDTLAFLGITASNRRLYVYRTLRSSLSSYARRFWDGHSSDIEHGIIHAGRTERYFKRFRDIILPLVMSRADQHELLRNRSAEERARLCDRILNKARYRYTMRTAFSQPVVRHFHIGAHSTFFHSGNGGLARTIMARVKKSLSSPGVNDNPYIAYIMTGNFSHALPFYLQPEIFPRIKMHLGSLVLFCGTVQDALTTHASQRFSGYNLSDIFEYMTDSEVRSCAGQCVHNAAPSARIVYWNTLKRHCIAHGAAGRVRECTDFARELFTTNKSFFYDSLSVVEVV